MDAHIEMDPAARIDAEVLQDVLRELEWDKRLRTDLVARIRDGIVTLTGAVGSYIEKVHAVRVALCVHGVLDVVDEIEVVDTVATTATDTALAHAVRHALEWDACVGDRAIPSTVSKGFVTLEGEVDYLYEREEAARAVRGLRGLRGLLNKIRVRPSKIDPSAVRQAIEQTLERRADREADRIHVSVGKGVVTLTGRVHSWQEKESIVGAVSHAPGVQSAIDHLRVDPWF